jgi:hypothetical protein
MKIASRRTCDVCGQRILGKYCVQLMDRRALRAFLHCDSQHQPTWQEVGDGSGQVRLDICMDCHLGMSGSPPLEDK